ncbi:GGDEF domain-containing protein [Sphingomonas sp.]|uniref:GGDEF domain-containing protein n=1 Tax=Sphingomonas sp. TaxID=28214 RepID=UPI0025F4D89A|nr:GGDEF domain-containing protein [Sphingomonas sp.]
MARNHLTPEPPNYEFAYRVCQNPEGPLAKAVSAITDGGFRLTAKDIDSLGGDVANAPVAEQASAVAQGLVAQTQMQVEGFADLVAAMRADTQSFGRNLAASADAIRASNSDASDVLRLTHAMLDRVQSAESQLEAATREASDLRKKLEEARDNARRDPLTDLPNRRVFEESFAERAARGEALCLAVCDIDHFKRVNDGFGHAVGDRVLKAVGSALAEQCEGHLVARYGGEEFVILFSGLELAEARRKLDAARVLVAGKRYRLRETDAPLGEVTFSSGLTAALPGEDVGEVFIRADQLLYSAKADGRNCIKLG